MKDILSQRLAKIKPSLTVSINVKANALREEGRDVLVLAAGEPDFDTPVNIRNAAVKAMEEGQTRYVPGKGTPALQKAIIKKGEPSFIIKGDFLLNETKSKVAIQTNLKKFYLETYILTLAKKKKKCFILIYQEKIT